MTPEHDAARPRAQMNEEANEPSIEIYQIRDIRRALKAEDIDPDIPLDEQRSQEEHLWRRRLQALVRDPRRGGRSLLIADDAMIERIEGLKTGSPHFAPVIDLVLRAAKLSNAANAALLLPHLLLLGPAGIGKSFTAQRIAEALQTHIERVSVDLMSDHGTMTGLSIAWKGARPGRIAQALIASTTASPVFYLDEVDKANPIHMFEQPLAFLHNVLEPENASRFADDYLTIPMRADYAIWILTANSVDNLASTILDRLMILSIESPTWGQQVSVVEAIYAQVNARHNTVFVDHISQDVIARLLQLTPRAARKTLELACGFAKEAGRDELSALDIDAAIQVLTQGPGRAFQIGFLQRQD